jgi:hypothetical protein
MPLPVPKYFWHTPDRFVDRVETRPSWRVSAFLGFLGVSGVGSYRQVEGRVT